MSTRSSQIGDDRDQTISQLRSEILSLRKSEEDYYLIEDQMKMLQGKYRLLSEEKNARDKQHQIKRQSNHKTLLELKRETDLFREDLRQKHSENKRMQVEANELRKQCEDKNGQLESVKAQRAAMLQEEHQLAIEQARLKQQLGHLKDEKDRLELERVNYFQENEDWQHKNQEIQQFMEQLTDDSTHLTHNAQILKVEIQTSEKGLHEKADQLRNIIRQISKVSAAIKQLEVDINDATSSNEKCRGETSHYYRLVQSQDGRAAELQRNLLGVQNTLHIIANQRGEIAKDIDEIKTQNTQLTELNNKLSIDNQNCEKHIALLMSQNQCLLKELDKLSEEDQLVRNMLNRRQKIKNSRSRFDALSKTSLSQSNNSGSQYY